jgi:hypothetical protein
LGHADDGWPDISAPTRGDVALQDGVDAALIIAIERYDQAQPIPGAVANGRAWRAWLRDSLDVNTIKVLENEQATREEILLAARGLADRARPGPRLWVVYIGHGAPSKDGGGMLVGADARQTAASLESRSVRLDELQRDLGGQWEQVVFVQDACFSGMTSSGDLAPGLAPLVPVEARSATAWTILSAGRNDEYAGPLSDGSRPAFSYLALGALRGWGDEDDNGTITADEIRAYADDAIFQTITGRSQRPQINGPDVVLARSGRERGPDLTDMAVLRPVAETVVLPDSASIGQAENSLASGPDYASLALEAAAKAAAAQDAQRLQDEARTAQIRAEAAIQAERLMRLDAQRSDVLSAAARDYAALHPLLDNPTDEAVPIFEQFIEQYGRVTVSIDDISERVEIPEVERARKALARLNSGKMKTRGERRQITAITTGVILGGAGVGALVSGTMMQSAYTQDAEAGRMSEAELTSEAQTINLRIGSGYGLIGAGVVVGVGVPLFFTAHPGGIRITGRW